MTSRALAGWALVLVAGACTLARAGGGPYIGPLPYLKAADNPIAPGMPNVCIEVFEDGSLDLPGVTGNGSVVGPGGLADSVDADDGAIDGSGTADIRTSPVAFRASPSRSIRSGPAVCPPKPAWCGRTARA